MLTGPNLIRVLIERLPLDEWQQKAIEDPTVDDAFLLALAALMTMREAVRTLVLHPENDKALGAFLDALEFRGAIHDGKTARAAIRTTIKTAYLGRIEVLTPDHQTALERIQAAAQGDYGPDDDLLSDLLRKVSEYSINLGTDPYHTRKRLDRALEEAAADTERFHSEVTEELPPPRPSAEIIDFTTIDPDRRTSTSSPAPSSSSPPSQVASPEPPSASVSSPISARTLRRRPIPMAPPPPASLTATGASR